MAGRAKHTPLFRIARNRAQLVVGRNDLRHSHQNGGIGRFASSRANFHLPPRRRRPRELYSAGFNPKPRRIISQNASIELCCRSVTLARASPDYNTVDATYTGDLGFVRDELYWSIRCHHLLACSPPAQGIKNDSGWLAAGESGVQIIWMDAKVGYRVVTPSQSSVLRTCFVLGMRYNAFLENGLFGTPFRCCLFF